MSAGRESLYSFLPVGREDWPETESNQQRETSRWVGKPWRRIELHTVRTFYKGEEVDVARDLSVHVGLRRLGLAFTFSVGRHTVLDYSEERQ